MNTYSHLFPALDAALTDGLDTLYREARAALPASNVAREWHDAPRTGGVVIDLQARV
ncbi:MAG TPA: hypothetical protein VIB48_04990 [Acidimicrobiia bacterium]